MKKISLSFLLVLFSLFLGSFSCQDHYVPPAQIQTLEFEFSQGGRTAVPLVYVDFYLQFLSLGSSVIDEYGIVYSFDAPNSSEELNTNPEVDGPNTATVVFPNYPDLDVQSQFTDLHYFDEIYYRAYAKIQGGGTIYGGILHYRTQTPQ